MERKLTLPFASVLSLSFFIFIIVHFFFLWTHFHCGFYDLCVNAPHTSEKKKKKNDRGGGYCKNVGVGYIRVLPLLL
jgi:hypothetical protein